MVRDSGGMVRLGYSSTRKESGLGCTKVYWVIFIRTIAWIWTMGCPLPKSIMLGCFHTSVRWFVNTNGISRSRQLDSSWNQGSNNCRDPCCIWIRCFRTTPWPTVRWTRIRRGRNTWHLDPNKAELLRSTATYSIQRELCSAFQANAKRKTMQTRRHNTIPTNNGFKSWILR